MMESIPYSPTHSETRILDIFPPEGARNGRCILWIHGGGWTGGSRRAWHAPARTFCNHGYVCASMDYRLAPAWTYPSQVEDACLAMAFLRDRSASLGFRPDAIAAIGSSAGGYLAAMLALTANEPPAEAATGNTCPNAVVAISTPTYFDASDDSFNALRPHVTTFLGCAPPENPHLYRAASPLERVTGSEPPFLLVHGDCDPLVPISHAARLRDRLLSAGAHARLEVIHGAAHGFPYGITTPHQHETMLRIDRFLAELLP